MAWETEWTRADVLAGLLILVLAGFFLWALWPNSLCYNTLPPSVQTKREIRNLAVAQETYYIDNDIYPPAADRDGYLVLVDSATGATSGYVSWLLTTPIAHQASLPNDPFSPRVYGNAPRLYRYATNGLACWIMASVGPDGELDSDFEAYVSVDECACDITRWATHLGGSGGIEYDPTNGTESRGDIFRTGP